ncbi:MAG: DNA recombination protein RmuC [Candidatus Margulisiibacteriota bacterium]
MEIFLIIMLVLVLLLLAGGAFYLTSVLKQVQTPKDDSSQKLFLEIIENLRKEVAESSTKNRQEIQGNFSKISDQLMKGMTDTSSVIQKQFQHSSTIIKDVTEKLVKLDETNKQVLDFSKQLQSLENVLKNPKHRGILGETILENLLSNVLQPNQYQSQYKFKNGDLVDFVIFYKDRIIPVDAKFSLEKYNKIVEEHDTAKKTIFEKEFKIDLKNRIDETSKYIRPTEDTTEFAIMFIPAEGVYYDLLVHKVGAIEISSQDLIEYAYKKHVIIVSPTSFFAYLETVLLGLKAIKMEENIKTIISRIADLGRHLQAYETYMQKVGGSLDTTVNQYNQAYKELGKIDKDVYKITEGEVEMKPSLLLVEKTARE